MLTDLASLQPAKGAETPHLAHTPLLAAEFCRLARERFTGIVYAECAQAGGVFSLRDGRAVFFEDIREGGAMPDSLLEQGLLTKLQYCDIAVEVLNSPLHSEDVAFCQHAVRLGVLTQPQVDNELQRRVRQHVVRAVSWEDCRIELDPDPDGLLGILEYPQEIGPLVYMGVRTFFGEERLEALMPNAGALFVRWLVSESEAAHLFGLDAPELNLLQRLRPDVALAESIAESGVDPLEAKQLVYALVMARSVELTHVRASARDARSVLPGRYSAPSGVRAERLGIPAATRPKRVDDAEGKARRSEPRPSALHAARVGPAHTAAPPSHAAPQDSSRVGNRSRPAGQGRFSERSAGSLTPEPPRQSEPSLGGTVASPRSVSDSGPRPRPLRLEVAAPAADLRRPRRIGATLERLGRELKQLKAAGGQVAGAPAAETDTGPVAKPARANLEQLMRMRKSALNQAKQQADSQGSSAKTALDSFRAAQDALRGQQFARAHELMGKASAAEPNNPVYAMHCKWAAFRAKALAEEGVAELRALLRERISDDQHKAFAYYALGHIALEDKKEEAAERFFSKAIELDGENKDAQRHLRILELRRKAGAQDRGNKLFGIELGKRA
jgi:hypothetical protein